VILDPHTLADLAVEITPKAYVRVTPMAHAATPLGAGFGVTRFASPTKAFKVIYIAQDLTTAVAETLIRDRFYCRARRKLLDVEAALWGMADGVIVIVALACAGNFQHNAVQDYLEELRLHDGRDDGIDVDFVPMRCLVAPLPSGSFCLTECDADFGKHCLRQDARRRLVQNGCHLVGEDGAHGRLKSGCGYGLQECVLEKFPFDFVGDESCRELRRMRLHIGFLQCFGRRAEMARCHMHGRAHGVPVGPAKRIEPQFVIVRVNSVRHPGDDSLVCHHRVAVTKKGGRQHRDFRHPAYGRR
jgi:hypothetical protein